MRELFEVIEQMFGIRKIDDIESLLPKNTLIARDSRIKISRINKELKESRAVFNPEKPTLKKLGIKLVKSKNGLSVDFAKTPKYLYGGKKSRKSIVKIKLKGNRNLDFEAAWKKAGFKEEEVVELDKLFTWHHLDDYNPVRGTSTLQLVKSQIHKKCTPHIGSVKQVEVYFNIKYK